MPQQTQLLAIIKKYKLNKDALATSMGVSPYTFRMKITGDRGYHFTPIDLAKLHNVLQAMAAEILALKCE